MNCFKRIWLWNTYTILPHNSNAIVCVSVPSKRIMFQTRQLILTSINATDDLLMQEKLHKKHTEKWVIPTAQKVFLNVLKKQQTTFTDTNALWCPLCLFLSQTTELFQTTVQSCSSHKCPTLSFTLLNILLANKWLFEDYFKLIAAIIRYNREEIDLILCVWKLHCKWVHFKANASNLK